MITFTPLSGSARSSSTVPLAYLLQVDDIRILLDCGSPDWNPENIETLQSESGDGVTYPWQEYCRIVRKYAPDIDLVLLSHGDLAHAGLYAYAYSHWDLRAPCYTTLPVQAMARIATMEDVEGIRDEQEVDVVEEENDESAIAEGTESLEPRSPELKNEPKKFVATVQEVHEAFDAVNTLRYSQPTHLQGKCQGLTITPFSAGHTLGGTIWKIRSPSAGTIVYAVNLNHMRERHIDGTVLYRPAAGGVFEPLARPDLFITDADRVNVVTSRRKDRDAALIDAISATLSSRSSLLLPCDSSTRLLELLVLLDQHWKYADFRFPICLLSRNGREMLTFVRSMMEWLGGTVSKEDVGVDGSGRTGGTRRRRGDDDADEEALGAFALRFRFLEFFPSPQSLLQTYSSKEPKLILAVPASLSHGPSRLLFSDFAAVPDNVVLLTSRGEEGTLGRILFDKWNNSQRGDDKWDKGRIGSNIMMDGAMTLKINSKVPLQGAELEAFLAKEKAAKDREAAHQASMARNQRILEADEDESDEDSDSDSDEEDEVERALDESEMDIEETSNPVNGSRRKRKISKNEDDADWGLDIDEGLTKQLLSFDIYLKGNVSKATSFFKSAGGQTHRFRMFPYVEKKRRVDEYGETIDVGMWLRKGKVLENEADDDTTREARRNQAEGETEAPREPPSKFVTSEVEIQLACRLLFVDMEGLNDGRAVKMIVPQVNPRKMIIVHAHAAAADALIDSCANIRSMTRDIYAPSVGEMVQIGQHTNSFSISLSDELLSTIKMSRSIHFSSTIPILEPSGPAIPTPDARILRASRILGSRPIQILPQSTMIGELKLTALKSRLASIGVQAELVGEGVLICGAGARRDQSASSLQDTVAVRKTGRGRVELEGNVSDIYYVVRKEIYNLHALVAT
ncbi:beta-lactamase-like protein [Suillus paluster]|uniref:beta-lactamase-like protein n=1 Tax=Suillus paluster TaxID=48578 RepID=UPI001B87FA12|nr:beta-lactamase-like protein [Suillus paluster]KAG1752619.1 beta-lactamase-like protein [Suillus paluster]